MPDHQTMSDPSVMLGWDGDEPRVQTPRARPANRIWRLLPCSALPAVGLPKVPACERLWPKRRRQVVPIGGSGAITRVTIGPDTARTDSLRATVELDGEAVDTGLAWEDCGSIPLVRRRSGVFGYGKPPPRLEVLREGTSGEPGGRASMAMVPACPQTPSSFRHPSARARCVGLTGEPFARVDALRCGI